MTHILDAIHWIAGGRRFPSDWAACYMIYPPKKVLASETEVVRNPSDTRPISLRQVGNKLVSATLSFCLKRSLGQWSLPSQKGFIAGRRFTDSLVMADTTARTLGMVVPRADKPVAVLLDLRAAFPSVQRSWMHLVMKKIGLPPGMRDAVAELHREPWAISRDGSSKGFPLQSGTLQGDPMASTVFIWSFEATLRWLRAKGQSGNELYACADDVLILLRRLQNLVWVASIFRHTALATGLHLNVAKCAVIPLWSLAAPQIVENVRVAISRLCPDWLAAPVVSTSVYLGLPFGPGATEVMAWSGPLCKLRRRTTEINETCSAPTLAAQLWNCRGVTVLSYVAQFYPPPKELGALEVRLVSSLFRLPGVGMTRAMITAAEQLMKVRVLLPTAYAWSVLARALHSTLKSATPAIESMQRAATDSLPFAAVLGGQLWPAFWKTSAIGLRLYRGQMWLRHLQTDPRKDAPAAIAASRRAKNAVNEVGIKTQRAAYQAFVDSRFPQPALHDHLLARMSVVMGAVTATTLMERLPRLVATHRPHTVQCAIRGALNLWPTTSRLHTELRKKCIFGCDAPDDLATHYWAGCQPIREVATIAWRGRYSGSFVDWQILDRFDLMAFAFTLYTTVTVGKRMEPWRRTDWHDLATAARAQHVE